MSLNTDVEAEDVLALFRAVYLDLQPERQASAHKELDELEQRVKKHGTRGTYNNGCRCAACREANRVYAEKRRRAAGVEPFRPGPRTGHGSTGMYRRGCRCEVCRRDNAKRHLEWSHRRAAS